MVSVSVSLCVTANLGIDADRRQVMGINGISGLGRSFIKVFFSKHFRRSNVIASFAYCDNVNGPTGCLRAIKSIMKDTIALSIRFVAILK